MGQFPNVMIERQHTVLVKHSKPHFYDRIKAFLLFFLLHDTTSCTVCLDHTAGITVSIVTTILEIYGYTFSGAQGVSPRMNVMRKCEGWQLTFQTGALLFGNGHDAMANYDLARCDGLSENFK